MFELVLAAVIQQAATPPAPPPSDDIVVSGLRDIDDPASAVTHQTLGSNATGRGARASREVYQLADRFARCAIDDASGTRDRSRKALDGVVNGASQRFWQGRIVEQRSGCALDPDLARYGSALDAPGYDTSYYERGALFVRAMQLFAPDLKLTPRDTGDPAVQARFNAREIPLARFRLPLDRRYFEAAVCFVRLQPQLAGRLVQTDAADSIAWIEAAMVNRARVCVGNARKVFFDPSQFRFYIADAVYRWAVATRGTDSLIPR